MLQTIQKASEVLSLFDQTHTEWGVREVAERLNMAKSSTHDLLISLAQTGFLHRTEDGRYRLGWRLVAMSDTLLSTTELCQQARPVMEELATQYRETVHLAVLDDTRVVVLDKLEGKQAVRVELNALGARIRPHASAAGKILLSDLSTAEVERIIELEGLPRFTPNTITDKDKFYLALEEARRLGYAYDLEEMLPDLCCVSAPVYNHTRKVVAAICMSVPVYRFQRSRNEYRTAIIRAARTISAQLGCY